MRFADYILLAIKNLFRQKMRTFLTIVAITVGSLSVILMMSLIISIRQSMMDTLGKMGAFTLVSVSRDPNSTDTQLISGGNNNPGSDEGKKITDDTLASVKAIAHVVDATPIVSVQAKTMRLEGSLKKQWSSVLGYDPSSNVFDLPLLAGRALSQYDMDKIVVGSNFVETYGYNSNPKDLLGKHVLLTYDMGPGSGPDWGNPPAKPPQGAGKEWYDNQTNWAIEIPVEIVGIADNKAMDDKQNYVTLAFAKRLMTPVRWEMDNGAQKECEQSNQQQQQQNKNSSSSATQPQPPQRDCNALVTEKLVKDDQFTKTGYGSITINVDDTKNVADVAKAVEALGYGATTAENMIAQMNRIFLILTVVLGAIGGISLFVAAIGIINTMIMATYERTREIGVMRACGATRSTILLLFSFEAAILGFLGGVFGVVISFLLGLVAKLLVTKFGASLGTIPIDQIGSFPLWLVGGVLTFTTLIGVLSGLYPAIRASRLNPVDALRYE